ncbi:MAG: hypothetical protein ABIZ70_07270 [Gemmatimonadales bacterium]
MRSLSSITPVLLLAAAAAGCSSTGSSDLGGNGRVAVRLSTTPMTTSGSSLLTPGITVTLGSDVVIVDGVQLVARKIKLQRADGTCPTPVVEDAQGSGSDADEGDTEECPNVRLGPMLLSPPLGEGVDGTFSVDLPAGSYHELQMQIHKPTSSSKDAAFLAANPGFAGTSIKVTGTFNGVPFVFTTSLTAEIEVPFLQDVVVVGGTTTSLTLQLDVRSWFKAQGGLALLNPGTLTQQDRQRVEQNIRASFHAFRDENGDGRQD